MMSVAWLPTARISNTGNVQQALLPAKLDNGLIDGQAFAISLPITQSCGQHGQALIILLCGCDKGSQHADIARSKAYWMDWKRRNV